MREYLVWFVFFFQAEDGIRDYKVTGVQTCALPISPSSRPCASARCLSSPRSTVRRPGRGREIGRGACRGKGENSGGAGSFKKKKTNKRTCARTCSRNKLHFDLAHTVTPRPTNTSCG